MVLLQCTVLYTDAHLEVAVPTATAFHIATCFSQGHAAENVAVLRGFLLIFICSVGKAIVGLF
jgi:hypothetical protein